MHIVGHIDSNEATSGRRINRYVIGGIVQELGPGVSLDVMGVIVAPPELNIDPKFVGSRAIVVLVGFMQQTWLGDLPLEGCEEDDISAT